MAFLALHRAHFNPQSPRGERPPSLVKLIASAIISIHALREEGDVPPPAPSPAGAGFQSTPSARRATRRCGCRSRPGSDFNPRPPRGGRRPRPRPAALSAKFQSTPSARRATMPSPYSRNVLLISIHALREEGDLWLPRIRRPDTISIHALREEGDARRYGTDAGAGNFNPRPPRGGRRDCGDRFVFLSEFQSTPSARRATLNFLHTSGDRDISIHALREEGDQRLWCLQACDGYFNPRPPRGGRRLPSRG